MRRIYISILGIVLSSGCAEVQIKQEPQGNYVESPKVGIFINNKSVVESLLKDLLAERAGIRRGDIIVSVNGKKITTRKEFISLIENKQRGDHVL
jgi:S1-C subfamily serine protease